MTFFPCRLQPSFLASQESPSRAALFDGRSSTPLNTTDFASFILQAQSSGAQVLGLANAGTDLTNLIRAIQSFELNKEMNVAATILFLSDVEAPGLKDSQGLVLTSLSFRGIFHLSS